MTEFPDAIQNFFFPKFDRRFLIRVICLAVVTFIVCRFIISPAWTNGGSMLPTYQEHQFLPVLRCKYWFSEPQRGDVVMVRFLGNRVMLLKRIVALEGQTVEFRDGVLYVDGEESPEEWNHLTPCDWNLAPRVVPPGEVYVIGDNRSMPINEHHFGHVRANRIVGAPLW